LREKGGHVSAHIPDIVKELISLEDAFIVIYILTAIAAAETMVLVNLRERVSGWHKLFRLTTSAVKKPINDASDDKTNT
jgi:hypothetical protein